MVTTASPIESASEVARQTARRDRLFFGGMAISLALIVLVGFAPTYYLRPVFESPNVLTPALRLHGIVFTAWFLLLVAQTSLIAARLIDAHRWLGVFGAALGVAMMGIGAYVAVTRGREAAALLEDPTPVLAFLTVPLGTLVAFPVLLGSALCFRKRSDVHKRLMLLATLEVVTLAVARLPVISTAPVFVYFVAIDLLLVPMVLYDLVTRKDVHGATLWGGVFLIGSQALRLSIAETAWWLGFAAWLTS
jgi:hypothetical protein